MTSIFISNQQKNIISNLKKIILDLKKRRKILSIYDYFYFTNWSQNYGARQVNIKFNNTFHLFENIKSICKIAYEFSSRELIKYNIQTNLDENKKYQNLIISYTNNNELKKKSFINKIFNSRINSFKSTLCVLINFDTSHKSLKTGFNMIIINKKKFFAGLNPLFYFFFLKFVILVFIKKKNIYDKNFYKTLDLLVYGLLKKYNFKKVFIAYESQPHQHYLIKNLKVKNKNTKIIGYLHSCLPSLPVDFIFKDYEPDLLVTNGKEQKNILIQYLGWPKKKVNFENSFRYSYKNKRNFVSKIFLPYSVNSVDDLLNIFQNSILSKNGNFLSEFVIQNHPFMKNSKKHNKLLIELNKIKTTKKKITLNKNNTSIVVGVSASILEILEHGVDVINICENETLQSHNSFMWKSINVSKLSNNVFKYSIKKKHNIIKFGNNDQFQKKYGL